MRQCCFIILLGILMSRCGGSGGEYRKYYKGLECGIEKDGVNAYIQVFDVFEEYDRGSRGTTRKVVAQLVGCGVRKNDVVVGLTSANTADYLGSCEVEGSDSIRYKLDMDYKGRTGQLQIFEGETEPTVLELKCKDYDYNVTSFT